MKIKCLLITFVLGLGLTLGLVWLLGGRPAPATAAPVAELHVCSTCTHTTVQDAVDAANTGDVIKVAAGVYTDTIACTPPPGYPNPPLSGLITQVVYISKSLTIRGGYTTADWNTSDPVANRTTLDAESGKRVIFIGGDITVTLENLRITGGDATGLGGSGIPLLLPYHDGGGGVYVITATVTLNSNAIYSNTAGSGGGVALAESDGATLSGNAIYSNMATFGSGGGGGVALGLSHGTTLSGNTIHNNAAYDGGGVVLAYSNGVTLSGNAIHNNMAGHDGGGVALAYCNDAMLSSNDVYNNKANGDGGGVEVYISLATTLSGNNIYDNTATNDSGGVEVDTSVATTLSGNAIYNNTAGSEGGGVKLTSGAIATLVNNVIADNQVGAAGSGVHVNWSTAALCHNTIARNTGGDDSGIHVSNGIVAMTNTILVRHTVGITVPNGTATLESTLWGSGAWENVTNWNGAGIVRSNDYWGDPAFVDPNAGGYHIGPGSAAIDEGMEADVATDKDGMPRPQGAAPDLGAYEYVPPIGGHTEPVGVLALLWPWVLLAAAVITAAIGAVTLKWRRA